MLFGTFYARLQRVTGWRIVIKKYNLYPFFRNFSAPDNKNNIF